VKIKYEIIISEMVKMSKKINFVFRELILPFNPKEDTLGQ
jgi:hypothetical protein